MAIALAQTKASTATSASSHTATWTSNTTTGNLIVLVAYTGFASFSVVSSISDSQINTYTKIDSGTTGVGNDDYEFWYAKNITGGTTPTVTVHYSGTQECGFIVREYSGIDTTAPLDQHVLATNTNATPISSGTVTTLSASELLIGWGVGTNASYLSAAGTGYVNFIKLSGSGSACALIDQIVSSTGTYSASFTTNSTGSGAAGIATFKGAGGTAYTQTNTGALSFVGAENNSTLHQLTASLSFVGAISRAVAHKLSAGLSIAGTVVKAMTRTVKGGFSFAGAFSAGALHFLTLTAALRLNTTSVSYLSIKDINLTGTNIYAANSNNQGNNSQSWEF